MRFWTEETDENISLAILQFSRSTFGTKTGYSIRRRLNKQTQKKKRNNKGVSSIKQPT